MDMVDELRETHHRRVSTGGCKRYALYIINYTLTTCF